MCRRVSHRAVAADGGAGSAGGRGGATLLVVLVSSLAALLLVVSVLVLCLSLHSRRRRRRRAYSVSAQLTGLDRLRSGAVLRPVVSYPAAAAAAPWRSVARRSFADYGRASPYLTPPPPPPPLRLTSPAPVDDLSRIVRVSKITALDIHH